MSLQAEMEKRVVSRYALNLIKGIDILGLGSGTTVSAFVEELASSDLAKGLKVIPSSSQIESIAKRNGLNVVDPSYGKPDLTIDGADEIDSELNLLKGGGGALVREKVLAVNSDYYVIIADHRKLVNRLCTKKPLPIEVLPYGVEWTRNLLEVALNSKAVIRMNGEYPFISDNGNYILDIRCEPIEDPSSVEKQLKLYPGVVDVGIFTELAVEVLIAFGNEVKRLSPH